MDIKKPDIKAILEKLSFLKNNMALLVPIVLALTAGLLFVPTTLLSNGLQEKIRQNSVAKGSQLQSMINNNEVVSVEQASIEVENQKKIAEDANQITLMNRQCMQRPLLTYHIFPEPDERSALIFEDFGRAYITGVGKMINDVKGNVPPAEEELERLMGEQLNRTGMGMGEGGAILYEGGGAGPGARGGSGEYGGMMGMGMGGQTREIEDAVCTDRAMSAGIYVDPMEIAGYEFWSDYKYDTGFDEAVKTCWYWQLGYWILEDVFATIKTCNGESETVLTSPVKRLKTFSFESMGQMGAGMYGGGGPYGGGMRRTDGTRRSRNNRLGEDIPEYVIKTTKKTTGALVTPCTDRYSGDDFHIIHFNLSVVVQSQYVMEFIKALCSAKEHRFRGFKGQEPEQRLQHNQISVLEIRTIPVVRRDWTHRLYRYGEDAVVEINLICEYLLQKNGYEEVIPQIVKEALEKEAQ